jgi:hypothetical protein
LWIDSSSVATSQKLKKKSLGHSVEIILFPWNLKQVEKHFHNWRSLKFAHFVEVLSFGAALHQFSTFWKTSFLQTCYPFMVILFWDDQSPMMLHQESQKRKKKKKKKHKRKGGKKNHTVHHFDNTHFHGSMRPNVVTLVKP